PGVEEWGYDEIDHSGEAKILAPDADDLPTVDFKVGREVASSVHAGIGFEYSRHEIRKARMQGLYDLVQEKSVATREALDRLVNRLVLFGAPEHGIIGLRGIRGKNHFSAQNGPYTAQSTPGNVILDFSTIINEVIEATHGAEIPNTIVMPLSTYN